MLRHVIQVQPQQVLTPGEGEVLVRMRLRPVNPADCSLIQGRMGRPPLPLTPGAEGTALILASPVWVVLSCYAAQVDEH